MHRPRDEATHWTGHCWPPFGSLSVEFIAHWSIVIGCRSVGPSSVPLGGSPVLVWTLLLWISNWWWLLTHCRCSTLHRPRRHAGSGAEGQTLEWSCLQGGNGHMTTLYLFPFGMPRDSLWSREWHQKSLPRGAERVCTHPPGVCTGTHCTGNRVAYSTVSAAN